MSIYQVSRKLVLVLVQPHVDMAVRAFRTLALAQRWRLVQRYVGMVDLKQELAH